MVYNYNGGLSYSDLKKMSKKKFLWLLRRLAKQKKDENDAIRAAQKGYKSPSSRGSKYLGKIK